MPKKTPVRKPFSPGNHASNDAIGKNAVLDYLHSINIPAEENPDKYGIDLIVPGYSITYEVEHRIIWKDEWPHSTVHIPERKSKFMKDKMIYAVVNKDCTKIMFCRSEVIRKYKPVEVPNKAVSKGEHFYDVPLQLWTIRSVAND